MSHSKIIHEQSNIAPLHIVDLFEVPSTQISFETHKQICEEPQIPLPSDGPITFEFTTPYDEYLRLDETFFHLKYEIKLNRPATECNAANWKLIKSTNYLLHSFFKHVSLEINGVVVTQSVELYPYRAFLEAFLAFSPAAQSTHLKLSGYGEHEKFVQPLQTLAGTATLESEVGHELIGKLHFDLTFQHKALLPNTKVVIKLYPHDPSFYLIKTDAAIATPKVVFKAAKLYTRRNKATTHLLESHGKVLMTRGKHSDYHRAKYPISRIEVKTGSIGLGQQDYTIPNLNLGILPTRVFAALVTNAAFNGDATQDPLKFEPHGLSCITLYVNGDPVPQFGLNGQGIKEYIDVMQVLNQAGTRTDLEYYTYEKFKANPIYAFDLDADCTPSTSVTVHTNPKRVGDVWIKLKFATAPAVALTLIVWLEYENIIEIDVARNVTTSWPL